jgi:hypothetical protein
MASSACRGERWSAADMSELDAALQQDKGANCQQANCHSALPALRGLSTSTNLQLLNKHLL